MKFRKMPQPVYAVSAMAPSGEYLYYTGKAGSEYLSPKIDDAFPFQTYEGAERKAAVFRKMNNFVWFVADRDGKFIDMLRDIPCYQKLSDDELGYLQG